MDTNDMREIFDMGGGGREQQRTGQQMETAKPTKESIMNPFKDSRKLKKSESSSGVRRPTGMNREVYALLYSDNKDRPSSPSLVPTDIGSGYRQPKARLGRKHVRPWKWMTFTNDARTDDLVLSHWRRVADEGQAYPYARFNKLVEVPTYTKEEYEKLLVEPTWSKEETDHLMELCKTFDLRFIVIHDRFDSNKFQKRSIEALKERYYSVCNRLARSHDPNIEDSQLIAYDAPHECRRKMQLEKLLNRTAEQVQEEEVLVAELRKIELRKKERERKQQDLQKLISAAEQNTESSRKNPSKKSGPSSSKKLKSGGAPGHSKGEGTVVFKSYDKSSGVSLRSSKLKTPMTLGQKKAKTIEQLLDELGVPLRPMPTEQICVQFNDLRNDILLLLDLKSACDVCEFELQSLKHRYEGLSPIQQSAIALPDIVPHTPKRPLASGLQIIDVVSSAGGGGRKRRLATLDSSVIKKARKS